MSKKLIAMVATAVMVDGQRVVIPAGGELPELNEHDAGALLASGAAKDPAQEAAQARKADKEAAAAQDAFAAERQAVQQAQASTEADAKAIADAKAAADAEAAKAGAKGGKAGAK